MEIRRVVFFFFNCLPYLSWYFYPTLKVKASTLLQKLFLGAGKTIFVGSGVIVAKMTSHAIFQYNVLAIDDTHNTWTNMIVKINILRLLGSSDDKGKIRVARPEGSANRLADGGRGGAAPRGSQGSALKPLWSKRQELKRPWRNSSRKDQNRDNLLSPVKPTLGTG